MGYEEANRHWGASLAPRKFTTRNGDSNLRLLCITLEKMHFILVFIHSAAFLSTCCVPGTDTGTLSFCPGNKVGKGMGLVSGPQTLQGMCGKYQCIC